MDKMKNLFTTGEAAEICNISQQTIIRCFDSGRLDGFRIPGSRFRRIPRENLIKFMKDNGIPLDNLNSEKGGKVKVLIVDDDAEIIELMVDADRAVPSGRDFAGLHAAGCQRQHRLPHHQKQPGL